MTEMFFQFLISVLFSGVLLFWEVLFFTNISISTAFVVKLQIMAEEVDAYKSLLDRLYQYSQWPSVYRFKFIFKTDHQLGAKIENWFGNDAKVHYLQSSANKYQSLTVDIEMATPEDVIAIYKRGAEIDGLVML